MIMTVGEYLRSLVFGIDLPDNVITRAAYSPMDVGLGKLEPSSDAYPSSPDEDFSKKLDYASSTLYYAVLGVLAGGSHSEQIGDVRVSKGGYSITMGDRERFRSLADALRLKWGFQPEGDFSSNGMYDYSYMRM